MRRRAVSRRRPSRRDADGTRKRGGRTAGVAERWATDGPAQAVRPAVDRAASLRALGAQRVLSRGARSGAAAVHHLYAAAQRHRRARTWGMARPTRRWTFSRATIACSARTPTGCPASTTRRSPPRPSWSSELAQGRAARARTLAAKRFVERAWAVVAHLRRPDRRAVPPPGLRPGLAALALYDGRGAFGRRAPRLRPALSRRIDLSRNAPDQLGSQRSRRRSRTPSSSTSSATAICGASAIRSRRPTATRASRSRRRAPRRCWPTSPSPCIRAILATPLRSGAASGFRRCSSARSRSSPTRRSTPSSAPAP